MRFSEPLPPGLAGSLAAPPAAAAVAELADVRRLAHTMTERDAIYIQILHHGLLRIRDSAALGHLQYCAVESEHLHNIPSLIGESNEHRHVYYFTKERTYYLERLDRSIPGLDYTLRRYEELWAQLQQLNEPNVA